MRREAEKAKRMVEGPLALMKFSRADRPWITDEVRVQAKNILDDITQSFKEGQYSYVINEVKVAQAFLNMLDLFDVWIKETLEKEYSICPICGEALRSNHRCSDVWQNVLTSRAGEFSEMEIKVTENENGCSIISLIAQKIGKEFELKTSIQYCSWIEFTTVNLWTEVTDREKELVSQIVKLLKLEEIIFEEGYDSSKKKQLKAFKEAKVVFKDQHGQTFQHRGGVIFVCDRWSEDHVRTGIPYLCQFERQIGTSNSDPVIIVNPVCNASRLQESQKELATLRDECKKEHAALIIGELQEKFSRMSAKV